MADLYLDGGESELAESLARQSGLRPEYRNGWLVLSAPSKCRAVCRTPAKPC
ncbi:MAG: hypothetical protein ACLUPV_10970 [Bilophila wadsworthia]